MDECIGEDSCAVGLLESPPRFGRRNGVAVDREGVCRRVCTVGFVGRATCGLVCFDASTLRLPLLGGHASSIPCVDSERLYAYFSTLGIFAFDTQTVGGPRAVERRVSYSFFHDRLRIREPCDSPRVI